LVDSWSRLARKTVTHVAEATGFVHFELGIDATSGKRVLSPEHYIVAFPNCDKRKQRYHSSLLTMRIVNDVGVREGALETDGVEHIEFELLLRAHEAPVQQQLRITAGPVRANPKTGLRESMRIDLGRCLRQIATDVVDCPVGKRVVRSRWWISVDTLRLVCTANALDCEGLDRPGAPAVEWVICLCDERHLSQNEAPEPREEKRDIDDLVDFIAGKSGISKRNKKKKRKGQGKR